MFLTVRGGARDTNVTIAHLSSGDYFGEMAILEPWTGAMHYTVVCDTFTQLLAIDKRQFPHDLMHSDMRRLVEEHAVRVPKITHALARMVEAENWADQRKRILRPYRRRPAPTDASHES